MKTKLRLLANLPVNVGKPGGGSTFKPLPLTAQTKLQIETWSRSDYRRIVLHVVVSEVREMRQLLSVPAIGQQQQHQYDSVPFHFNEQCLQHL
jgi:hypothetical protein